MKEIIPHFQRIAPLNLPEETSDSSSNQHLRGTPLFGGVGRGQNNEDRKYDIFLCLLLKRREFC
jgi:hypothetical protein